MATILVIDDDPVTADLLRLVFHKKPQVNVVAAANSVEGLNLAQELHPNVIVMDLLLPYPGVDGWEATTMLKNNPDLYTIPVIVVTAGDSGFGDEQRAFDAGCDGYVRKPFLPNEMFNYLSQFLPQD